MIAFRHSAALAAALLISACSSGGSGSSSGNPPAPPPAPAITIPDVTAYLSTSRCPGDGMPTALEPGCAGAAPQRASDPMLYRRADWSGHADGQIEDAYRSDDGTYFVNTFSYPPHGPFAAPNGDGGDVLVTDGTTVRISYTQNGAPNGGTVFGWWVGPNCGGTGWVLYDNKAPTGSWASEVASLAGSTDPAACPATLNPAYTQWRLETVAVPFLTGGPAGATQQTVSLPAIISEHYDGPSIALSTAMERVVMPLGLGRALWEAWSLTPSSATFACPGIAGWNAAPTAGWSLQDRRCLTQIVTGSVPPTTGDLYQWPPAGAGQ